MEEAMETIKSESIRPGTTCGETAMSCEKYREALIDATAAGEQVKADLPKLMAPGCRTRDQYSSHRGGRNVPLWRSRTLYNLHRAGGPMDEKQNADLTKSLDRLVNVLRSILRGHLQR